MDKLRIMAIALMNVFDADVVNNIYNLIPRRLGVDWEMVEGCKFIYKAKHILLYDGGPEGSVYFYKERRPRWYRWERNWGEEPRYTYIDDGPVAVRWSGDVEYIAVLPANYEDYNWDDYYEEDDMRILDSDFMEDQE